MANNYPTPTQYKKAREAFVARKLKLSKRAAANKRRTDKQFARDQKANPFAPSKFT